MSTQASTGLDCTLSIGGETTSGGASETFTPLGELVSIDRDGGSRTINDATHLQSTARDYLGGIMDFGKVTLTYNLLATGSDEGQAALSAAIAANAQGYDWQMTWPLRGVQKTKGDVDMFSAIITSTPKFTVTPDKIVQASIDLQISGPVTTTAGS